MDLVLVKKEKIDWTMTSSKGVAFDHQKPSQEMSGDELLLEFSYLRSGSADECDQRWGVKLGLSPELAERLQEIGEYLSCMCPSLVTKIPEPA